MRPLTFWPWPLIFVMCLSAQGVLEDGLEPQEPWSLLLSSMLQDRSTLLASCLAFFWLSTQGWGVGMAKLEFALGAFDSCFPIQNYISCWDNPARHHSSMTTLKIHEALGPIAPLNIQTSSLASREAIWFHTPCCPEVASQAHEVRREALRLRSMASSSRCEEGLFLTHSHMHPSMPNTQRRGDHLWEDAAFSPCPDFFHLSFLSDAFTLPFVFL